MFFYTATSIAQIFDRGKTEPGRYPVAIETAAGDASGTLQLDPAEESFVRDLQAIENGETDTVLPADP